MTESNEVTRNMYQLLEEIAGREKAMSVKASDYGTAFMLAILEGLFREAVLAISQA
jgi:hypothetical protein